MNAVSNTPGASLAVSRCLSAIIQRNEGAVDADACVELIGERLAALHAGAARSPAIDEAGRPEAVTALWQANFAELITAAGDRLDQVQLEKIDSLGLTYLSGRAPLFAARVAAGRICDGHADLLADDIFCLDDGPRIIDCLESSDRLRYRDVIADVALLAMDLERLGRADLAGRFLSRYAEVSSDDAPVSLVHFWIAYRALQRARVACLTADAEDGGNPTALTTAAGLLTLAHRRLQSATVRLALVGGPPASGKSALATELSDRLGWQVVSSDRVRKQLAGLRPTTPAPARFGAGLYTTDRSDRTYGELLARATRLLQHGHPVIIDASWGAADRRATARRAARAASAVLCELRCSAPEEVALARARERQACGGDPSDATEPIALELRRRADPWPEAHVIATGGSVADAAAEAMAWLAGGQRG